ncbi:MAG: CPCC family cysteine-rich protein [Alphaproteobacteria bacterium]
MYKGFPCPCCKYLTRSWLEHGTFEICPICLWEDDYAQSKQPDLSGGANVVSLNQARLNFEQFGVSEEKYIGQNRMPNKDEHPI